MAIKDLVNMGLGGMKHDRILKKAGLTPRENALMAYRHEIPYVIPCAFVDVAMFTPAMRIERYEGLEQGYDGFGVEWVYVPEEHAPMPVPGKCVLEDITQWREVVHFPDLDAIDWEKEAFHDLHVDGAAKFGGNPDAMLKNGKSCMDGGKLGLAMIPNGMFERLHALMGFENALMALMEEPEECYAFFSAVADYKIRFIKKIKQYYPVDVINAHDDYASNDRTFMSMDTWRELIKPNLKKIVDATHAEGLIYQHHSCGYLEPLLPEFIEIGIDAVDVFQGNCNRNLKELKEKYGKQLTFVGGLNNVEVMDRVGVTPRECKEEYHRVMDILAPGGSYVSYPGILNMDAMMPILSEHFGYAVGFYQKNGRK